MDEMVIQGGIPLQGTVRISGAKNAALPALAASLLNHGQVTLSNVPNVKDVRVMCQLMTYLGAECERTDDSIVIRSGNLHSYEAPYDLVRTMRASVLLLGPLLARFGHARVSQPGGCAIGNRPIDIHLKGLMQLGAEIELDHGMIDIKASRLTGAEMYLDFPTVTGTENLMMAAAAAQGDSVIINAAQEPEITDLAELLTRFGVQVQGAGSPRISISSDGKSISRNCEHSIIADRVEAGTYIIASAATGGSVDICNANPAHLTALLEKLSQAGCNCRPVGNSIEVRPAECIRGVDLQTAVYPGFPTDLQAQFMALMCIAEGESIISETIFENRFMHVAELNRMGAQIVVRGRNAFVKGGVTLSGADVMATDLRASASLIIAGLAACNETRILRVYHLDRGYEQLDEKLRGLGAVIHREKGRGP